MKMLIDASLERTIQPVRRRDARTKTTVTPMDTNVLMDMTVAIVCTPKKDTKPVPRQRIQWEVACYTNDCIQHIVWNALANGVGREKGIVKQV